jgi:hypothetical protein
MKLIPAGNLESADPVLAVRWCLDRSETQKLKEQEARNMHILFVIVYEGGTREDRLLVPLQQAMTYLNFRRPGNHTVFAAVVWNSFDKQGLSTRLLDRSSSREYDTIVMNRDRSEFRSVDWFENNHAPNRMLADTAEIDVIVPREHFPKEPPKWLKQLVNAGHGYPPVDQCDFRRRMLGVPFKVPFFAAWAIITTLIRFLIVVTLLFLGMRRINFAAVIHPWQDEIPNVFERVHIGNSWFNRDSKGSYRSRWYFFLRPIFWLVIFGILTLIKIRLHMSYWALIVAGWSAAINFTIATWNFLLRLVGKLWKAVAVVAVGITILTFTLRYVRKILAKKRREKELLWQSTDFQEQLRLQRMQSYDDLYKLLACKPTITPALSDLPPERQTLRLRYLDLKAKVCRPFAVS